MKSFLNVSVFKAALGVLLFAYFIELLQYLNFLKWMGLGDNRMANVVLGNYFEWTDMMAYTLGIIVVLGVEKIGNNKSF